MIMMKISARIEALEKRTDIFELDEGIDLTPPFLRNMVSDKLVPGFTGLVTPVITTDLEMNHATTAEEWDNM